MFSKIAHHYDRMNRIMSFGVDTIWRKHTAKETLLVGKGTLHVLDVATGTGDLAIAVCKEAKKRGKSVHVEALDFNEDMLKIARKKLKRMCIPNIRVVSGDALRTSYKERSFDVITSGFALRNFDDLEAFISETKRLLKPGGRIVLLDVAKPETKLLKFFQLYYFKVIPALGARYYNEDAYTYLVSSIWKFDKDRLMKIVRDAGFKDPRIDNLTLGAAFVLIATKPSTKRKPN
jgi:demethylmenaquinone methyltransferase/2-methoxy-6-polyprenyl-1,4-benzoquinol methylase